LADEVAGPLPPRGVGHDGERHRRQSSQPSFGGVERGVHVGDERLGRHRRTDRDLLAFADAARGRRVGEPERRGDERNFARYAERVAEMKAAIQRKEADIAAIKREIAKLPS
jgi:hypothetical protein